MLVTATMARTRSMPAKFGAGRGMHPARAAWLRNAIQTGQMSPRMVAKWKIIMSRPDVHTLSGPLDPWRIVGSYYDRVAAKAALGLVRSDAQPAIDYGLRYQVYRRESDAAQVVKILAAYANQRVVESSQDSSLKWCETWPLFVQAAMLVEGSRTYTPAIKAAIKDALVRGLDAIEPIAYTRSNNWAGWGLAAEISISGYTGNRPRFDAAVSRWRSLIDESVKSGIVLQGKTRNNVPINEIYREGGSQGNGASGLAYSSFSLAALSIAAEYARLNGEWLFDHTTPDGSSLKGFYETVAYWYRNPTPEVLWFNTSDEEAASHPYYNEGYSVTYIHPWVDILGALWPNTDASWLMNAYELPENQDHSAYRAAEVIYRNRPLYG